MSTTYTRRISLIVPAAARAAANRIAMAMGWGEGCYHVPLSADGVDPASHYGLTTVAQPEFVELLQGVLSGDPPPEGVSATDLDQVRPVLLFADGDRTAPARAQFDTLAASQSLQRVQAPDE